MLSKSGRFALFLFLFAINYRPSVLHAQGISFESGNWASVKSKASASGKLVYLEFYTTWCGPCKLLDKNIFPQKSVGDVYNKEFVNYHVDAEKGEGIVLAKKYSVSSYPMHLFIDPSNGNVVFRQAGAPDNANAFIKHAENAMQEWKSPRSWESYTAEFPRRKKDTAFLKEYLSKAARLGKNNDKILDAYVETLQGKTVAQSDLDFLIQHVKTLDNRAVALLWANHERIDAAHIREQPEYTLIRIKHLFYPTMEKAVVTQDESLLNLIAKAEKNYMPNEERGEIQWYRHRYFVTIGETEKAKKAAQDGANHRMSRTNEWYFRKDSADRDRVISGMRAILVALQVPEKDIDARMQRNLRNNPSQLHPYSAIAALWLNNLSMEVFEAKDTSMLKQALQWSARAMELAKPSTDLLPSFADTHAWLLMMSGERDKAIEVQKEAIRIAKTVPEGDEMVKSLEESLLKMSSGGLSSGK